MQQESNGNELGVGTFVHQFFLVSSRLTEFRGDCSSNGDLRCELLGRSVSCFQQEQPQRVGSMNVYRHESHEL